MAKQSTFDDFYGSSPTIRGPLFDSAALPAALSGDELLVAQMIERHQGAEHPVSVAQVRAATGLSERQVKGIVERLVVEHRMRIGARREEPSGYFVINSAADLAAAVGPYKAQILAMWKRLRVLEERAALRELLGQLRLED